MAPHGQTVSGGCPQIIKGFLSDAQNCAGRRHKNSKTSIQPQNLQNLEMYWLTIVAQNATNSFCPTCANDVMKLTPFFHSVISFGPKISQLSGAVFISAMAIFSGENLRAANILSSPGFEATPGGVETNLVTGWMTYGSGINTLTETGVGIARTGSNYFKVYQAFNGVVNYNGAYQDTACGPGASYAANGWARTSSGDQLAGGNEAWIEVTFRDTGGNISALYRSAIISTNSIKTGVFPVDTWINLPITNRTIPLHF